VAAAAARAPRFGAAFRTVSRGRFETERRSAQSRGGRARNDFTAERPPRLRRPNRFATTRSLPPMIAFPSHLRGAGGALAWRRTTGDWRLFETLRECALGSRARGHYPSVDTTGRPPESPSRRRQSPALAQRTSETTRRSVRRGYERMARAVGEARDKLHSAKPIRGTQTPAA